MKKKIFMVSSVLCLTLFFVVGVCWPSNSSNNKSLSIKGPVLIDRLSNSPFNLQLIYSTIDLQHIEVFNTNPSNLTASELAYSSFTEGFIPKNKNDLLLNTINVTRSLSGKEPISYYYNYIETSDYDFVAISDGLSGLYIINHETGEVFTPTYDLSFADEKQYIYHIAEGTDSFYVLSAKANSYEAFWYCIDKEHFNVMAAKKLMPPITACKRNQYALDSSGTAYFVGTNNLYVVSASETYSIPLGFTPNEIYFHEGHLYAFSVSELFLNYSIFNEDLQNTAAGYVNLPNKQVSLVDCSLNGSVLYTITYDANHPTYRNYLTFYDLNKGEMIYCLALKDNSNLALLGMILD